MNLPEFVHAQELSRAPEEGKGIRKRLVLALLCATLYAGTLMPGEAKAAIEAQLWHLVPWSSMAHFVLFAVIAAFPSYGRSRAAPLYVLGLALLLACSTELLQNFVPGRHPRLFDVVIDLSGTLVGYVMGLRLPIRRTSSRA